jgi:hypothetical protein
MCFFKKYLRLSDRLWAPQSYSVGIKSPYRGVCSQPLIHVKVKDVWAYTFCLPYIFMACTGTTCHV